MKVGVVECKRSVRLELDELGADEIDVLWVAVGCEVRELGFPSNTVEPTKMGDGAVKRGQRNGVLERSKEFDFVAVAATDYDPGLVARIIPYQNGGFFEGRWKESACCVRMVVICKLQGLDELARERTMELVRSKDIPPHAFGQCRCGSAQIRRRPRKTSLDQALELRARSVVEDEVIDFCGSYARFAEAISHGMGRKPTIMF